MLDSKLLTVGADVHITCLSPTFEFCGRVWLSPIWQYHTLGDTMVLLLNEHTLAAALLHFVPVRV